MVQIEVGRLWLNEKGVCYYGTSEHRVISPFPIQIGSYILRDINDDENIRLEIVREKKKHYIIGYDDNRLGMVVKAELHSVHVVYVILEAICRKFKVGSSLFEMRDITQNGVTTRTRIEIDNPGVVEEEELRDFLCRRQKSSRP